MQNLKCHYNCGRDAIYLRDSWINESQKLAVCRECTESLLYYIPELKNILNFKLILPEKDRTLRIQYVEKDFRV